ncbi:hypothetical protein QR680_002031 [Steinernema hermaphroditum]|uniref:MAM domain-containing protein n=1 Tax=Steinernema hermaphroditum TaxID=289476 RepID=A0AA39LHA2_9BILA|nr:hypothetical protein QR680_002031 [Steinernema hermaphroditum]
MLRRIAVLLSVLLGIARADIRSSSELNCDFNQRCRWRNGTGLEDSGEWLVSNIAAIDTQRQIESMHTESNDEFAYTFGMNGRQSAMLISDVISCQLGGAKLKLWYWKTDSTTTLEVCIRQPPGNPDPSKLHCYNALSGTHAQQWIYIAIELPPISQPFELVIRAFFTQPVDIIAIDDISYDAILCETVNSGASEGAGGNYEANYVQPSVHTPDIHSYGHDKSGFIPEYVDPTIPESNLDDSATPLARPASPFEDHSSGIRRQHSRKEPRFKSLCPTVDCNFDDNTFCGYSSTILETDEDLLLGVQPKINAKPWILSQARVSNSLTGIPGDLTGGYFAYAGETNDPKDVFVLTTTDQVRVTEQARLELHIFLAGSYGRFRVCLNGFSDCPLSISGADLTVDARRWNSVSVDLSPGLYTIHLLVDQLRKNYVVGLDQVQLLNRSKSGPISCKTR